MGVDWVFFAGGGTGGHIYPALAVAQRIGELRKEVKMHFFCSDRPVDSQMLGLCASFAVSFRARKPRRNG